MVITIETKSGKKYMLKAEELVEGFKNFAVADDELDEEDIAREEYDNQQKIEAMIGELDEEFDDEDEDEDDDDY